MQVTLIDHMGTDLTPVNAARVSFNKKHDEFVEGKDDGLIRYLAREDHWTPFGHAVVCLHLKAPIFVARQLGKSQVGFVWNEVSRRYVDDEPEFFAPTEWRSRPEKSIKQGSGEPLQPGMQLYMDRLLSEACDKALDAYEDMLRQGVCPEQARMVLPQNMYTEWWWTGSLVGWARVYNLRIDPHTQKETQDIAKQIGEIIEPLYPVSWKALTNYESDND